MQSSEILFCIYYSSFHQASGSGSESAVRTQKSTKSNGADESDNDTGSNDHDGIGSVGLNARDGSDNGSGTQVIFFCFFYRQAYTLIFM